MKIFIALLFIFSVTTANLYSQSISGKVVDGTYSEPLIGASVRIAGENVGATTNMDGTYLIQGLKVGSYDLEFSYIGYQTMVVRNISVRSGGVTQVDVTLNEEGFETDEIVIVADYNLANETALLFEQKNAPKIQDGISEQQMRRAPDPVASDVLKRVMGVNIVDDKYVFVRGTSERYNTTTLNGVIIPSPEPDKRSFSFDIFPSNLLENIIISKTFTADQPGNYSGGLVQLTTKDFPDQFSLNFTTSTSYVTGSTTKGNFLTYDAGQSQILGLFNSGLDDGFRSLPSGFPDQPVTGPNELGQLFRNNWAIRNIKTPFNGGFSLSLGNRLNILDNPFGFFASYTYSNSFNNKEFTRTEYTGDTTRYVNFDGRYSEYSVSNGGIVNLSYRIGDNNKISWKNTFSVSSDDKTETAEGFRRLVFTNDDEDRLIFRTTFVERDLKTTMLTGSHYFHNLNQLNVTWRGSYSETFRNEPDFKSAYYRREYGTDDRFTLPLTVIPNEGLGRRFFSKLRDINRTIGIDFDMPFIRVGDNPASKIRIGGLALDTRRNFSARSFEPYRSGGSFNLSLPLEEIFKPENIGLGKLVYVEVTNNSDRYNAWEDLYASYISWEIPFNKLRIVSGLRFEYSDQRLEGFQRTSLAPVPINVSLKDNHYLPTLNLTYLLDDKSNLRASFTQTVSRPELRELAPFGYVDFIADAELSGNPKLKSSLIQNYDLRWETFPQAGEVISVSLFYKKFDNPIERIIITTVQQNTPAYSFANAENGAINYGIEIEGRKNLGFLSKSLSDFAVNGNLTFINSKVDLAGTESGTKELERRLQGQAPFTINLGLYYENYDLGTSINLSYNRSGDRISEVGRSGFKDVFEKGRNLLDFSASKKLFQNFEMRFTVRDILNEDEILYQEVQDGSSNPDNFVKRNNRLIKSGTTYGLSFGYRF